MNQPIKFTTKRGSRTRNSVNHSLPRRSFSEGGSLITSHYSLLTVLLLALSPAPKAFGVTPPPDGGYPGGNTAEGQNALFSLTTGLYNTADGYGALYSNTTGYKNTADGYRTLYFNTTGYQNMADGFQALYNNTTGFNNTAVGLDALFHNMTGDSSTATGSLALFHNTTGTHNTAIGSGALESNTIGTDNTACGYQALFHNISDPLTGGGSGNTALGSLALYNNTVGFADIAVGSNSLYNNTEGSDNIAVGGLFSNTIGYENIAVGGLFLNTIGHDNTAVGYRVLDNNTTGAGNVALGGFAGEGITTGNNNIDIGYLVGATGDDKTIRIGTVGFPYSQTRTFIGGISGTAVTGTAVVVDGNGQLGVAPSSACFKDEIKPMNNASEALLSLRPVTFRYKKNIDPKGAPQFGLVAEEVEKVNPDLVVRDAEGKVFTVRYEAVNAMLLNEFLKEHRKVEGQEASVAQLKSTAAKQEATIAKQQKQIEALTRGLQKVSDQLELSKPRPQMAGDNR